MTEVGIRALKQNASEVVAAAASGETITITDRGRPVALLGPLNGSRLTALVTAGAARPPRHTLAEVPKPKPGPALSDDLAAARDDERF